MLLLSHELDQAWAMLDVHNLKGTLPRFKAAVTVLVQRYGKASMALASNFYLTQRREAGIAGSIRVQMADPATAEQVSKAIDSATDGLWKIPPADLMPAPTETPTVPSAPDNLPPDTITDPRDIEDLVTAARTQVQGAAEKLAQDPARQTTLDTVQKDRKAKGWARIPEPSLSATGTCGFCALLATRGAVYKTKTTAEFQAHDGCKCHPEPVFTGTYVPSAQVMDWQQTYAEVSQGRSGADARAAFRQSIEGRPVTGLTKGKNKPKPVVSTISPAQAKKTLASLETSLPGMRAKNTNGRLDKAIAATERRIAELRKIAG
jgi:hypothetical protein